jgi:hypothetical protein
MTNTERLIATLEHTVKYGYDSVTFMVGKYTGMGAVLFLLLFVEVIV